MVYNFVMNQYMKKKENVILRAMRVILIIILLPFVLIYLLKNAIKKSKQKKSDREKIEIYNISQLSSVSGKDFELLLKDIFERLGYECELTKSSHDYGADIVAKKGRKSLIIQAKCYSSTVGVKAIQEIVSARKHYNMFDAVVVTNSYFSKEAETLASENDVKLIDRNTLEQLIKQTNVKVSSQNVRYSCMSDVEKNKITARFPHWIWIYCLIFYNLINFYHGCIN